MLTNLLKMKSRDSDYQQIVSGLTKARGSLIL